MSSTTNQHTTPSLATPPPAPTAPVRDDYKRLMRTNEGVLWDIFYFYCLKQTGVASVSPLSVSMSMPKVRVMAFAAD